MTQESYSWLANNVLASEMAGRHLWWAEAARREGHEPRIYPGPVPIEAVETLLCSWQPETARVTDVDALTKAIAAGLSGDDLMRVVNAGMVGTHKLVKANDNGDHLGMIGISAATHTYKDWLTGTIRETVADDALAIISAGMFRGRAQAFVQIERPEMAHGPAGIDFSPSIMYSTSLDGTWQSQINQTITIAICDNTARAGRSEGCAFKHTSNSGSKLGVFRDVSAALMRGETDFNAILERLLSQPISDSALGRFLDSLVPESEDDSPAKRTRSQRRKQEIRELYRDDARAATWHGTAFGLWQAATTQSQHLSQLRNTTGIEMSDTELRAQKVYGERVRPVKGQSEDERAMELVLASV